MVPSECTARRSWKPLNHLQPDGCGLKKKKKKKKTGIHIHVGYMKSREARRLRYRHCHTSEHVFDTQGKPFKCHKIFFVPPLIDRNQSQIWGQHERETVPKPAWTRVYTRKHLLNSCRLSATSVIFTLQNERPYHGQVRGEDVMALGWRKKKPKKEEKETTENRRKSACMAHKAEIAIEQPFP